MPDRSPALEKAQKSSIRQSPTFTLFPLLPSEIRQVIWDFSFTPRTVHIQIHEGLTPAEGLISAAKPWTSRCELKTACICFTALEGLVENPTPGRYVSLSRELKPFDHKRWTLNPAMKAPPPPGPVALYVCHESREAALKHYELAFGGINCQPDTDTEFAEVWKKARYGEKRIWINYEIDTIFLGLELANWKKYYCLPSATFLEILTVFAEEEVKKIRWLAFSESWSAELREPEWRMQYFINSLNNFTRLKGIMLYHIDLYYEEGKNKNWVLDNAIGFFLDGLEREKQNNPDWKIGLPAVEIREGWIYGYNRGRGIAAEQYGVD